MNVDSKTVVLVSRVPLKKYVETISLLFNNHHILFFEDWLPKWIYESGIFSGLDFRRDWPAKITLNIRGLDVYFILKSV